MTDPNTIPEINDEVKHKLNEYSGVVNAKYERDGKTYIDVRINGEHMWYSSPIENWTVLRKEADII